MVTRIYQLFKFNSFTMTKNNSISSEIVDLRFLNENFGNDYASYSQMIEYFLDQSFEKITFLIESVQKSDFENIKSTAHFLKSSFNIMGLKSMNILIEMEKLSTEKSQIHQIIQLLKQVETDFNQSVVEYKRILSIISDLKD